MKFIYYSELIKGNEILFWIYVILIITMILLAAIFVRKETKNESK